jgi:hypothetical protein
VVVALDGNGYENEEMVSGLVPEQAVPPEQMAEMTPVLVMVSAVPPTSAPAVPVNDMPVPVVTEEVATLAKVLALEKYGMLPTTAAVEVERPLNVNAPVDELYASGKVPERLVDDILLLNVVQSAAVRKPGTESVAF